MAEHLVLEIPERGEVDRSCSSCGILLDRARVDGRRGRLDSGV
jgi:hypothetical protein